MFSREYSVTTKYGYEKNMYSVYVNYAKYISKLNISIDTQEWRLKHIRGFLSYIKNKKIKDIEPIDVYDYFRNIENLSVKTKEHRAVCLRLFLNYLYENKYTKFSGYDVFPKIKCSKEASMPSHYTDKEIKLIVNSVNNKAKNGKRDLAIILLFAKFGLRPRDVRELEFKNISWSDNTLRIVQSKTSWINILPFDNDVRYALLDYIKNERPSSDLEYVFLKNTHENYNDHFYYNVINKYIKLSEVNINSRRHGPYIFRHSKAISLLKDGNGINTIASILGHSTTENAKVYLKLNYNDLKKTSLEVPIWNR